MPRFKGDPRWLTAKFASACHNCKRTIAKGEQIFYYPNGKHVLCAKEECGGKASREFASAEFDERGY